MKKTRFMATLLLSAVLTSAFTMPAFAENQEGKYRSELTNEWISTEIQNQRPIAVMVDNESLALDHYGVNQADIIYEVMNSTINGRISRLMCVVKDWKNLTRIGSIRSSRTTNVYLAAEYNAILCHDGTWGKMKDAHNKEYIDRVGGSFARFSNGKAMEFTEYVTIDDYKNPNTGEYFNGLKTRIKNSGIPESYEEKWYAGQNFTFSDEDYELSSFETVIDAKEVQLTFPHNSSTLTYNAETKTYDYSEYGRKHIDALDNSVTTFKNAIIECSDFTDLGGKQGYLVFDLMTSKVHDGYYLTNGKAIPITWEKADEYLPTKYYNAETGEALVLNTGKTYIAVVPSDTWGNLKIQ